MRRLPASGRPLLGSPSLPSLPEGPDAASTSQTLDVTPRGTQVQPRPARKAPQPGLVQPPPTRLHPPSFSVPPCHLSCAHPRGSPSCVLQGPGNCTTARETPLQHPLWPQGPHANSPQDCLPRVPQTARGSDLEGRLRGCRRAGRAGHPGQSLQTPGREPHARGGSGACPGRAAHLLRHPLCLLPLQAWSLC